MSATAPTLPEDCQSYDVNSADILACAKKIDPDIYGSSNDPPTPLERDVLPTGLKTLLAECDGNSECKLVAYDFQGDTGQKASSAEYITTVVDTDQLDRGVFIKDGSTVPVITVEPPGYTYSTIPINSAESHVVTIQTTTAQSSSEMCARICDTLPTCIAFNYNSLTSTCKFFSSFDASNSFSYGEASFNDVSYTKDPVTSAVGKKQPTLMYANTWLENTGGQCTAMDLCNSNLTALVNTGTTVGFSTDDLLACSYCPVRTFQFKTNSYFVQDELGETKTFQSKDLAIQELLFTTVSNPHNTVKKVDNVTRGTRDFMQYNVNSYDTNLKFSEQLLFVSKAGTPGALNDEYGIYKVLLVVPEYTCNPTLSPTKTITRNVNGVPKSMYSERQYEDSIRYFPTTNTGWFTGKSCPTQSVWKPFSGSLPGYDEWDNNWYEESVVPRQPDSMKINGYHALCGGKCYTTANARTPGGNIYVCPRGYDRDSFTDAAQGTGGDELDKICSKPATRLQSSSPAVFTALTNRLLPVPNGSGSSNTFIAEDVDYVTDGFMFRNIQTQKYVTGGRDLLDTWAEKYTPDYNKSIFVLSNPVNILDYLKNSFPNSNFLLQSPDGIRYTYDRTTIKVLQNIFSLFPLTFNNQCNPPTVSDPLNSFTARTMCTSSSVDEPSVNKSTYDYSIPSCPNDTNWIVIDIPVGFTPPNAVPDTTNVLTLPADFAHVYSALGTTNTLMFPGASYTDYSVTSDNKNLQRWIKELIYQPYVYTGRSIVIAQIKTNAQHISFVLQNMTCFKDKITDFKALLVPSETNSLSVDDGTSEANSISSDKQQMEPLYTDALNHRNNFFTLQNPWNDFSPIETKSQSSADLFINAEKTFLGFIINKAFVNYQAIMNVIWASTSKYMVEAYGISDDDLQAIANTGSGGSVTGAGSSGLITLYTEIRKCKTDLESLIVNNSAVVDRVRSFVTNNITVNGDVMNMPTYSASDEISLISDVTTANQKCKEAYDRLILIKRSAGPQDVPTIDNALVQAELLRIKNNLNDTMLNAKQGQWDDVTNSQIQAELLRIKNNLNDTMLYNYTNSTTTPSIDQIPFGDIIDSLTFKSCVPFIEYYDVTTKSCGKCPYGSSTSLSGQCCVATTTGACVANARCDSAGNATGTQPNTLVEQGTSGKCQSGDTGSIASTSCTITCLPCTTGRYSSTGYGISGSANYDCLACPLLTEQSTSKKCCVTTSTVCNSQTQCGSTAGVSGISTITKTEVPNTAASGSIPAYTTGQCQSSDTGTTTSTCSITCSQCGQGTYSSTGYGGTNISCTPCAAGTASATLGATSQNTCTPCTAGTYSSADGSATCSLCGNNQYSTAGASSCTTCVSGSSSKPDKAGCTCTGTIANGSYTWTLSTNSCTPGCVTGYHWNNATSACDQDTCIGGYGTSYVATEGTWSTDATTGIATRTDTITQDAVSPCTRPTVNYSGAGASYPTTATYTPSTGRTTSVTYTTARGAACPPGTYGTINMVGNCTPCEAGTYSSVSGSQSCSTCPSGTESSTSKKCCVTVNYGTCGRQSDACGTAVNGVSTAPGTQSGRSASVTATATYTATCPASDVGATMSRSCSIQCSICTGGKYSVTGYGTTSSNYTCLTCPLGGSSSLSGKCCVTYDSPACNYSSTCQNAATTLTGTRTITAKELTSRWGYTTGKCQPRDTAPRTGQSCSALCQNCASGSYSTTGFGPGGSCTPCATCATDVANATATLNGCSGTSPGSCTVACKSGFTPSPSAGNPSTCTCASGNYIRSSDGTCVACPSGQYSSSADSTSCSTCPSGSPSASRMCCITSSSTACTSSSSCTGSGSLTDGTSTTTVTAVAGAGTCASSDGVGATNSSCSVPCSTCADGTFSTSGYGKGTPTGACTGCTTSAECSAHTLYGGVASGCSTIANATCSCPANSTSVANIRRNVVGDLVQIIPACMCDAGYYSTDGYAPCTACASGTYTLAGTTGNRTCSLLPPTISTSNFNSDAGGIDNTNSNPGGLVQAPGWFNLNSAYSTNNSIVVTSNQPEVTWSMTSSHAAHLPGQTYTPPPGINVPVGITLNKTISADTKTFSISLPTGNILDSGTQGGFVNITITASNPAGSSTITVKGYGYPYVISNWNRTIEPNQAFGMFEPNKYWNFTKKYSYVAWETDRYVFNIGSYPGLYETNPDFVRKELVYVYNTFQLKPKYYGSTLLTNITTILKDPDIVTGLFGIKARNPYNRCLTAVVNNKMPFNTCDGSTSQQFVFVYPDSSNPSTGTGYWYDKRDGNGYRLDAYLNDGNNFRMASGTTNGDSQIKNIA